MNRLKSILAKHKSRKAAVSAAAVWDSSDLVNRLTNLPMPDDLGAAAFG